MNHSIDHKIDALFWDMPQEIRNGILDKIHKDPVSAFSDERVRSRALESFGWYDLVELLGLDNLYKLLDNITIDHLFPAGRRTYYSNAKRLLSKYFISPSGQDS